MVDGCKSHEFVKIKIKLIKNSVLHLCDTKFSLKMRSQLSFF